MYVVDSGNHRVQMFTSEGIYVGEWGSQGAGPGEFQSPTYICVDDSVYVADTGNHRIQKFSQDGVFQRAWGIEGSGPGEFMDIAGLAVVPEQDAIYVVDHVLNRIQAFDTNGNFQSAWSMLGDLSLQAPAGLSADHMGRLQVADLGNERILRWEPGGGACSWPSASPAAVFTDVVIVDETIGIGVDTAGSRLVFYDYPLPVVSSTWGRLKTRYE